jgi:hypothetical protein
MTDHKAVMRQALAYVEWQAFGSCRSPGWDNAVPLAHEVSESLRAALAEPRHNPWKEAVIDKLIIAHSYTEEHEDNPIKALNDLLSIEMQIALDPAVSSEAQALIDKGRRAALDETVEPVAWYLEAEGDEPAIFHPKHIEGWTPLYEHPPAPPASTEEDVKVVRLTREKYEAMCYLIDEIPALHIRMALLALLGDWPAQEGR